MKGAPFLVDPEVVALFADEPDLIALADAVASGRVAESPLNRPLRDALDSGSNTASASRRLARVGRSRRRVGGIIAFAFAGLLVPTALAFHAQLANLIVGKPAPPRVKVAFGA